jgi:hypothetical protein
VNFVSKIYIEKRDLRERGCGLDWKDEGVSAKERELPERGCGLG